MTIAIILGLLLVPIFLLNALGPLLIKKIQKLPARLKFKKHDEKEFLLSRDAEFNELNRKIIEIGFEYVGSSFMTDSHTDTNFSIYSNDSDLTCCMIVSMVSKIKSITYVEFSQLYNDGSMLDVSNADQISPFPKMDLKLAVRYPEIHEPKKLYEVFLKLKKFLKNTAQPTAYDKNKGFEVVEEFMAKESDILVEKGYCNEPVDQDGKRTLTFKGAYLMTWRSVFPGNKVKKWLDRSTAQKLLNNG